MYLKIIPDISILPDIEKISPTSNINGLCPISECKKSVAIQRYMYDTLCIYLVPLCTIHGYYKVYEPLCLKTGSQIRKIISLSELDALITDAEKRKTI